MSTKGPVILYELNEVPWRVFDWYVAQRPRSAIAKVMGQAACYTTRTRDEGELHPWSTWPTLHRGVYNTTHKILFINQDKSCAAANPPLWETLSERGVRVGVFGSLQSYPVPSKGRYCFYVPDTFAPAPETQPPEYGAFQAINLRQTKADGAVAQPIKLGGSMSRDLATLPFIGVRPRTFALLARQLVRERRNSAHRSRRALMQGPVAFDVFLHAFKRTQPEFCTFFTNHVAGAMHRYWKYAFPEDFGYTPTSRDDQFKRDTLLLAMDIADEQVGMLQELVDEKGGQLIIATSMGQQAIDRGAYHGELRLTDPAKMIAAVGFRHPWKDLLAMQPDFNFELDSAEHAAEFIQKMERLRTPTGESLWRRCRQEGPTVNMGMGRADEIIQQGVILLEPEQPGAPPRRVPIADLGVETIVRDPGTGYHQPLGCLIWYGDRSRKNPARAEIESTDVRGMIIDALLPAAGRTSTAEASARV